jgi:hypothetical protein
MLIDSQTNRSADSEPRWALGEATRSLESIQRNCQCLGFRRPWKHAITPIRVSATREPTHSSPPPPFFHYRIMLGGIGNSLDGVHNRLRETLPKLRANVFVPRQCLF